MPPPITELMHRPPTKSSLPQVVEPDLYGSECNVDSRVGRVIDYVRKPLTDWGGIPDRNRITQMLSNVQIVPQCEIAKACDTKDGLAVGGAYMYPFSHYYPDTIVIAAEPTAIAKPSRLIDTIVEELAHSYYQPVDKPLVQALPQNSDQLKEQLAENLGTQNLSDIRFRGYGFLTFFDLPTPVAGNSSFALKGMVGKEEYRASLVKQLFLIKLLQSTQFSDLSRQSGLLCAMGAVLNRSFQSGVMDGAVSSPFEAQVASANIFMASLLNINNDFDGTAIANLFKPLLGHLHGDGVFQFDSYIQSLRNPELSKIYRTHMGKEEEFYSALFNKAVV